MRFWGEEKGGDDRIGFKFGNEAFVQRTLNSPGRPFTSANISSSQRRDSSVRRIFSRLRNAPSCVHDEATLR